MESLFSLPWATRRWPLFSATAQYCRPVTQMLRHTRPDEPHPIDRALTGGLPWLLRLHLGRPKGPVSGGAERCRHPATRPRASMTRTG